MESYPEGSGSDGDAVQLEIVLAGGIPPVLESGLGNAFLLHGWCRPSAGRLTGLRLTVNSRHLPLKMHRGPNAAPPTAHAESPDWIEFWAVVPVVRHYRELTLRLEAELDGRAHMHETLLSRQEPLPIGHGHESHGRHDRNDQPRIVICMATYNPREDLFTRQIHSIRNQTYQHWQCLIADDCSDERTLATIRRVLCGDPRFELHAMSSRVGFYRNFERCLALVPDDVDFVALADHDDHWRSDKLHRLLSAFHRETLLVYSDMNIVDEDLNRLSSTYWTTRLNNYSDLAALLVANTITGASAMFRRTLLRALLPFPQEIGDAFHDHWIAATALTFGAVAYVDRPLYDYVQHSANVIGHFAPGQLPLTTRVWSIVNAAVAMPFRRPHVEQWRHRYFSEVLRLQLAASILTERSAHFGSGAVPSNLAVLRRFKSLDSSAFALAWLALRAVRGFLQPGQTLGAENRLFGGALWGYLMNRRGWRFFNPSAAPHTAARSDTSPRPRA